MNPPPPDPTLPFAAPRPVSRRLILKAGAAAGVASGAGLAVFGRALSALAAESAKPEAATAATAATASAAAAAEGAAAAKPAGITLDMLKQAEWIAGLQLTDEQRTLMLDGIVKMQSDFATLRARTLNNAMPPALRFEAELYPPPIVSELPPAVEERTPPPERPGAEDDLAFLDVATLGRLLRTKAISSTELTRLYLARMRRDDPVLKCVITFTEELALKQAAAADAELAKGTDRGPLHGIPYALKDLIAVPGYPTTWGAGPFRTQVREEKATVAAKLEEAGAVLIAKTSVGELAWGDVWYGGTTKNPWLTSQGSSGSSAGSASATSAGLTGFAIGTETWGSIVSPCTVCGVSGLRPTFGRVSRHGAMALAWSMDKIGPIARSVGDLATVFKVIQGRDELDPTTVDRPFRWPEHRAPRTIRLGVVTDLFDFDYTKWAETEDEKKGLAEWKAIDAATLDTLEQLGFVLRPVRLPSTWPVAELAHILTAEAAAAFDDLTRSGRDAGLVRQVANAWPTVFRQGQFVPAVEYIRANRIRRQIMIEMHRMFLDVDVYVVPSYGGDNLLLTNLTGHPAVVVPNGFRDSDGTPTSITFQGKLQGEALLLATARHFQNETGFHLRRPPRPKAPTPPGPVPPSRP